MKEIRYGGKKLLSISTKELLLVWYTIFAVTINESITCIAYNGINK